MEGSAEHSRCAFVDRPSRSPHEQFRTRDFLRVEPINTAVEKRCASRYLVLNLHQDKKIVGENRGEMLRFVVTECCA